MNEQRVRSAATTAALALEDPTPSGSAAAIAGPLLFAERASLTSSLALRELRRVPHTRSASAVA